MPDGEEPVVEPTLESLHADVKAQSTLLRELATTMAQLTARERVVDGEGAHGSGSGQRIAGQPTGNGGAAERPDLLELAQSGRVGAKSVSDEGDYLAVPELLQGAESGYEAVRPVSRVPGLFLLSIDLTNEYLKLDVRRLPAQEEYLWMSCFGAHMDALFVAHNRREPNRCRRTLKSYAGSLSQFAEFCHDSENISPLEATTATVVRYVAWIGERGHIGAKSQQPYMSAINTFFELHNLDPIAKDSVHLTSARRGLMLRQRRLETAPLRVPLHANVAYRFVTKAELIVLAPTPEYQHDFRALVASVVNFMFFAIGLTRVSCRVRWIRTGRDRKGQDRTPRGGGIGYGSPAAGPRPDRPTARPSPGTNPAP
eukprot:jgi/Tetstr1/438159/TSEL_026762.t1